MLGGPSLLCSIAKENHAIAKAALLHKLKLQSNVGREGWFAAAHDDRCEEQLTLVDQPGSKGVSSQLRTPDEDILLDALFQLSNGFGVEVALNSSFAGGWSLQRPRIDDFVRSLPDLCKVTRDGRVSPKPSASHTSDVHKDVCQPFVRAH